LAEKNTQDNQKSKKKHKWIGVFLIALLLLFIGLAGYYLERDLEPVPDNQIEENEVMEQSEDSSDGETAVNGEEESQITEETSTIEESTDSAETTETGAETKEVTEKEVTESKDTAASSDIETERNETAAEQSAEVSEQSADKTKSDAPPAVEEDKSMSVDSDQEDIGENYSEAESESDTANITDSEKTSVEEIESDIANGGSDVLDESDEVTQKEEIVQKEEEIKTEIEERETEDNAAEDSSVETKEQTLTGDQSQKTTSKTDNSGQTDIEPESNDTVEDEQAEVTDEPEMKKDIAQESEEQVENEEQLQGEEKQVEGKAEKREEQVKDETQNDFAQELEDPTLLERILSILGLSDSDFNQDLNILFVGLDSEENVAIGSVEADSIMLAKLRPELNQLQVEHIDEDTIYQGQLLRKYHNGDISLAVEEITETEIDYYVYLKYQGFEKVIDELGGVQITLEEELIVPGLGLNLKKGDNLLSGKEALNFVRWSSSGSMARFERQKLLINSVLSKLKSNNILFNVKELYNTIVESYNSIETDINPVLAAEIFNYVRENDELKLEFIE